MRVFLSILIALIAGAGSTLVLTAAIRAFGELRGGLFVAVLLIVLAAVLAGVVAVTVGLSPAGVLVVGAVHLLGGVSVLAGQFTYPFVWGVAGDLSFGVEAVGIAGLALGLLLIGAGLGALHLRRGSAGGTVAAVLLQLIVAVPAAIVAIVAMGVVFSQVFLFAAPADPLAVAVSIVAALALGAVALTLRWSGIGFLAGSVVVAIVGGIWLAAPYTAAEVLPYSIGLGAVRIGQYGLLLFAAATMLGLWAGAAIRRRRAPRPGAAVDFAYVAGHAPAGQPLPPV